MVARSLASVVFRMEKAQKMEKFFENELILLLVMIAVAGCVERATGLFSYGSLTDIFGKSSLCLTVLGLNVPMHLSMRGSVILELFNCGDRSAAI